MPTRSNLDEFNEERSRSTLPQLQYELRLLKKGKLEFPNLCSLAEYVSSRIGVNRTTLTRNPKYRAHLLSYRLVSSGMEALSELNDAPPEALRTHIALQQVELGQLREKVRRLESELNRPAEPVDGAAADARLSAHTFMLLLDVLERAETFRVDLVQGVVWDKAGMPGDAQVTTSERARAFCNWLRTHIDLPASARLVERLPQLLK
jgi:hypothetical protein